MSTYFETNNRPHTSLDIAHLMMQQKVQRQKAAQSRHLALDAFPSISSPSAQRTVYQPLMSMHRSPQQPEKISSHLNKTLMMLNSGAHQSRLQNLAAVATNTTLALELARKKKQEYQQQQMAQRLYQRGLPLQQEQSQPSDVVTKPTNVDV